MDNLVLAALGEPVDPGFSAHVMACPDCRTELDTLGATTTLARESQPSGDLEGPSPVVWNRIATELGLAIDDAAPPVDVRQTPPDERLALGAGRSKVVDLAVRRQRSSRPTWLLAAAAAVLALAAGSIGYVVGTAGGGTNATVAASARLGALPDGPHPASGTAEIVDTGNGAELRVATHGLPHGGGYYEVWLYNPKADKMVAVGTLPTTDRGVFPVPAGLDPSSYRIVDISAQKYDGDPEHQQSVLQGQLSG